MIGEEELTTRFTATKATDEQAERMGTIVAAAYTIALFIDRSAPDSREKSNAIGALEEAVMWANAAITHRETRLGGSE